MFFGSTIALKPPITIDLNNETQIRHCLNDQNQLEHLLTKIDQSPQWAAGHQDFVREAVTRFVCEYDYSDTSIISNIAFDILQPIVGKLITHAGTQIIKSTTIYSRYDKFINHTLPLLLRIPAERREIIHPFTIACLTSTVSGRTLFHQAAYYENDETLKTMLELVPKQYQRTLITGKKIKKKQKTDEPPKLKVDGIIIKENECHAHGHDMNGKRIILEVPAKVFWDSLEADLPQHTKHQDISIKVPPLRKWSPDKKKLTRKTPVQYAACADNCSTLKFLLERDPTQIETTTKHGNTLLHLAARSMQGATVAAFLVGIKPELEHQQNNRGELPIDISVKSRGRPSKELFLSRLDDNEKSQLFRRTFRNERLPIRLVPFMPPPGQIKALSDEITEKEEQRLLNKAILYYGKSVMPKDLVESCNNCLFFQSEFSSKIFVALVKQPSFSSILESVDNLPSGTNYGKVMIPNLSNETLLKYYKRIESSKRNDAEYRWKACFDIFSYATTEQKEHLIVNNALIITSLPDIKKEGQILREKLHQCACGSSFEKFEKCRKYYNRYSRKISKLKPFLHFWKDARDTFLIEGTTPIIDKGISQINSQIKMIKKLCKELKQMRELKNDLDVQYDSDSDSDTGCTIL